MRYERYGREELKTASSTTAPNNLRHGLKFTDRYRFHKSFEARREGGRSSSEGSGSRVMDDRERVCVRVHEAQVCTRHGGTTPTVVTC